MHAKFTEEERAFQQSVREFMQREYTPELAAKIRHPDSFKAGMIEWQKKLDAKGWAANGWPVEHGGCDWSATQKSI
ncbi:acyl-CoA dehydrogenase family protein, partial [Litorivivens sp.]